jgi:hypothetical protein
MANLRPMRRIRGVIKVTHPAQFDVSNHPGGKHDREQHKKSNPHGRPFLIG